VNLATAQHPSLQMPNTEQITTTRDALIATEEATMYLIVGRRTAMAPSAPTVGSKTMKLWTAKKKKRDKEKDKNNNASDTTTSGGSNGLTSAKANIAIAKYKTISLFNMSDGEDTIPCALIAHAQEESSDDDYHTLDTDKRIIKLLDDNKDIPSINTLSHLQFKQALANNIQQISELMC
jgi:hypothetical protein